MVDTIARCLLLVCVVSASGCAICCAPFDDDYACYGGIVERADRVNGRVGSKFADAMASAESEETSVLRKSGESMDSETTHATGIAPNPDYDLQ